MAETEGPHASAPTAPGTEAGGGSNRLTLVVAAAVVLVLVARMMVYQVRDSEVAVLLTFGRAAEEDTSPGPHLKWPWPMQEVKVYDARLRVLRAPLEEVATRDSRAVLVGSFLTWRISSARTFLRVVGDPAAAEDKLIKSLRTHQAIALARVNFGELVSADPQRLRYEEVEAAILAGVQADSAKLGVEVAFAGIRRLALPEGATDAVFRRMRQARETQAATIRSDAQLEADRLRNEAEQGRRRAIDQARNQAKGLLSAAEDQVIEAYRTLAEDAELAVFLQNLEALRALLRQRTTLVLDPEQAPIHLLDRDLMRASSAPVTSPAGSDGGPGEDGR
jgi:modulator of FtsH protease HflC